MTARTATRRSESNILRADAYRGKWVVEVVMLYRNSPNIESIQKHHKLQRRVRLVGPPALPGSLGVWCRQRRQGQQQLHPD